MTRRRPIRRAAVTGLLALAAVATAGSTAAADVVMAPAAEFRLTKIDGELTRLRPRIADIDGNGRPDVLVADANCSQFPCPTNSAYSILHPIRNDGHGTFRQLGGVLEGGYSDVRDVGAADISGHEGRTDLIATSPGTGWVNTPLTDDQFGGAAFIGLAGVALALGDFNHDGYTDAATATCETSTGVVLVALAAASGAYPYFGTPTGYDAGTCPRDLAAGDLNGDQRPDLVIAAGGAQAGVFVMLATPDGTFAPAVKLAGAQSDPQSVALGDVDADGRLDVFASDHADDEARVYRGTGSGGLATGQPVPTGAGAISITAADLDGDHASDLIAGYDGDPFAGLANAVSAVMGIADPAGTRSGALDSGGSGARRVAAADFNSDGYADVAVTHDGSATLSIELNVPAVAFEDERVTFGAVATGATGAPITVRIFNAGAPPLEIERVATDADSQLGSDFIVTDDQCSANAVAAEGSCTVQLRFRPTAAGTINGALIITSNAAAGPDVLDLSGTGTGSAVAAATPAAVPIAAAHPLPAPAARLTVRVAQSQRPLQRKSVTVTAGCNAACTLTASGRIELGDARHTLRLAAVSRQVAEGATVTLALKLSRRALVTLRRALAGKTRVVAKLSVRASFAGRPSQTSRLSSRLRR